MSSEREFLDDLASIVEGDEQALARHAELLEHSVDARDARFDAERLIKKLRRAGDDYRDPDDVEARLLRAIEAEESAAPAAAPAPIAAPRPAPIARPAASRRVKLIAIAGGAAGIGALGVAAAITLAVVSIGSDEPPAAESLSATIGAIARAAQDGASGVTVRSASGRAEPGTGEMTLASGSTIITDDRTRASIELSDGTTIILNQDTELTLDDSAPRGMRLSRGEIVAEVAHRPELPNAIIATPSGDIQVLGTKFLLTATDELTSVRVLRGVVRASRPEGSVDVKAGEEGILEKGSAPTVASAVDLARSVGWSELEDEGTPLAGIGELRAKRPGDREESERRLRVGEQKVSVRIAGAIARTEIEQSFENDTNQTLEGIYRFPLPADARIASLELDVDGRWEQGAFVSRERAQKIWRGVIRNATPVRARVEREEFIWVPGPWRDPALLEWQRGGQFELRIYPIPAQGARRIRIAYTQAVAPTALGRRYVYPLPHSGDPSTRVGRFTFEARIAGADPGFAPRGRGYPLEPSGSRAAPQLAFAGDDFMPRGEMAIDYRLEGGDRELRYWTYEGHATAPAPEETREEEDVQAIHRQLDADRRPYVLFALRPRIDVPSVSGATDYALVVDASQSMIGERFSRARELATRVMAEMDRRDRVVVLACDAECVRSSEGPVAPTSQALNETAQWLERIEPAGSSDMLRAIEEGARSLSSDGERALRVIYIGDGMPSSGYRRPAAISAGVQDLVRDSRVRVDAVGIGADADTVVLTALARAGGGHYVPFVPGETIAQAALSVLEATYGSSLENPTLEMPDGVVAVAPGLLPTIRDGSEVLVAARLESGSVEGDVVLRGKIAGRQFERRYPVRLGTEGSSGNGFVPAEWASRTIEELDLGGTDERARMVALSKAYGVMSRHTSLLVLESEAMFRAFGVDRHLGAREWTGEEAVVEGVSGVPHVDMPVARVGGIGHGAGSGTGSGYGLGLRGAANGMHRFYDGEGEEDEGGDADTRFARDARAPAARGRGEGALDDLLDNALDTASSSSDRTNATTMSTTIAGESRLRERVERNREAEARTVTPPAETVPDQTVATGTEIAEPRPANDPAQPGAGQTVTTRRAFGGGWAMRREWFTQSDIVNGTTPRSRELSRVAEAEAALAENPDSRDRQRELVRALARAGEVDRALAEAERWVSRDRLDPEALLQLADAVARTGTRDRAVRLMSGIADLTPDDVSAHERLAAAFERAGMDGRACSHRIAISEIARDDAEAIARAVRCERALGRSERAERILGALDPELRTSVAEAPAAEPSALRGSVQIDATWDSGEDLDLSIVTPRADRISWMGGRTVTAVDANVAGHEAIAIRSTPVGSYYVEILRPEPGGAPISGRVRVRAHGRERTIPFTLTGTRAGIARIDLERVFRFVPVQ
jgi:ferric-dicitrate binding protein FerR (iron transport regulator)/tetratricopeptide (TPR) repeat protein